MSIANTIARIPQKEWCGLEPRYAGGMFLARATCAQCGAHSDFEDTQLQRPQAVLKYYRNRGWLFGNRVKCPSCAKPASHPTRGRCIKDIKLVEAPMNAKVVTIKPTDAAKKAKPMVYVALLDYYDDAAKGYKSGHSDKTIADELGVAEAFVKKIREDDFGPLSPPSDVQLIKDEIAAMNDSINKLSARMSGLCIKNGWAE